MAAPIISILSDSSKESVGSHVLRVILFGTIPTSIPVIPVVSTEVPIALADPLVAPEVGAVFVISPTGVLDLVDYSSSFDSNPSEYSLPVTPELPLVSPFLCSDDSEADNESEPADQRARGMSLLHHHLSFHLHLLLPHPVRLFPSVDLTALTLMGRVCTIVYSLPTYTTSESSLDSSSKRSLDSSSLSVGPSRKRCRSPATLVPSSTPVSRSIAPALADLLPRKRFKDLNSPEVSGEEHMETSTAAAETVTDLVISDGVRAPTEDGIDLGVEVAIRDTREDEEEFEAEASAGGMIELVVDPLATGGISESIGGDIPDLEEELFTHKEEMDLETAQITTTAKLPTLKQGEYDMWRLRIEQYFQVQDYALWDVIENGNSFKPAAKTTTNADGTSTTLIPGPVTTEEKVQKKNDMKARSMLLMALPNEHLMTFNQYKDAKTLFAAIQTRFGGNEVTKKTQKTLLKKMYENFYDPSKESLDSIFNRLQKIVTQLVILGENISQEDLNLKFLRSLPSEWNSQIIEQEVNRTANSSSSSSSQNMAFVSSPSSTNELNNAYGLVHEDLEQIHEDDLEEMDSKWQLALLSMRTRRGARNQDTRNGNKDSSRRTVNVEDTSSKAMMAIDGDGFDWSYMADDEFPTNMALIAFSDSEVYNDKTCSKICLKSFETLKTQLDDLRIEFNKSEFNLAIYKRGLASVEEQLVFYKKKEVILGDQIAVLKRDISYKDSEISMLKSKVEKLKQEKESNQLKIEKYNNSSKSLDKLIGSQITDNSRKGVGFVSYNAAPPPHTGLFLSPTLDLSNYGLEEFQKPEFEGYGPKTSKSVSEDIANKVRPKVVNTARSNSAVVNDVGVNQVNAVKASACWVRRPTKHDSASITLKRHNYVDARGRSKHMTCNMSYLSDFKEFDGGYVTFRGGAKGGKITGKGTLKTSKLDFEDVYFIKELQFNPFSVLQMCDKKNSVFFTDTACFVLSPDFKLANESQVLLKVPRKNNMYSVDMKNIIPKESLTSLVAKATLDESMLWHRRLGHVSFKAINKLVKDNLVRGLPSKHFENNQTCVACLKGKQHKASSKSKIQNSITQPLLMLHMNLFGPTFMSILMNKKYCLVVTDDYSRFTWVFYLATKDETSGILKSFINEIENLVDKKVKIIRCHNGTEFKNRVMSEFYEKKGIKREFSIARTPQQNDVAKRRNRTLIEAARTMVLVVKPHNKTLYELVRGRTPGLSFMRPFGCHVTILNTLDYLGKFDCKSDDGFFVGYSLNSKAFRVYNIRTRKVEENLHIRFLEDKPIIADDRPKWLFDIDNLTKSMNYVPVVAGTNSNDFVDGSLFDSSSKNASNDEPQPSSDAGKKDDAGVRNNATLEATHDDYFDDETEVDMSNITNTYPVPSTPNTRIHKDHSLDHVIGDVFSGVQTRRMTNEQGFISVVYEGKTHEDLHTCLFAYFLSQEEPKRVAKALSDSAWVEAMQKELLQFKLQKVWVLMDLPKGHTKEEGIDYDEVLAHVARIEAIRLFLAYASFMGFMLYQMDVKSSFLYGQIEEEVYVCQPPGFEDPDYPDKVYKVVKALYGLHQALRAWYETLAKYLLDNGFHKGKIDQTLFIKKQNEDILLVHVYVDDIIFGSTNKELCIEFEKLMHDKFQMSFMGELTFFLGLQVKKKEDGIFISQDKYVAEILRMFSFTDVRTASTPMDTEKPLLKDSDGDDVDVHFYRSVIGSLMYLTLSKPDIMFAVCAYARFQVTPKDSPFDLEAYTDSDYVGASLDRKSTTGANDELQVSAVGPNLLLNEVKTAVEIFPPTTSLIGFLKLDDP
ncbi:putative ribonuclease H-like domain-containing protein [Tanacetum coccineum]